MDYEGIYEDFIASRRITEKATSASAYTERHHIVPRCFGGGNSESNIIRLTYREHIFAHALLLKAARTERSRWLMAASMSAVLNFDGSGRRDRSIVERRYGWARKMHGETICGSAHPGYRHDEHTLWHVDGRTIRGTRQDLIEETGLPFRRIYDLVNGHRDHLEGWCTIQGEAEARADSERTRATRQERIDGRLYHIDGRTIGKDQDTLRRNGVDRNIRARLATHGYSDGWCVDPEEAVLRAEGRWRRGERKKSAQDFGSAFPAPISSTEQQKTGRGTMTKSFEKFVNFVAHNTVPRQTQDAPYQFFTISPDEDSVYASASDWVEAHKLWAVALRDKRLSLGARKHARTVMKIVRKTAALRDEDLIEICQGVLGFHGNASKKVYTLYHRDGQVISGRPVELRDATGLELERVRDLTNGRRRYVKGWAASKEEAERGFVGGGRPRKKPPAPEPEFFQESGIQFF